MKIIPAIDLIDGKSVRLSQGDYDQKILMPKTPQEAIKYYSSFDIVGRIHIVDLIGAAKQETIESNLIAELKTLTDLPIQVGGGLRNEETLDIYDSLGVDYFVLGTRAIMDLDWLAVMVEKYPKRIYVGIDARGESIYINGWKEDSGIKINEYLAQIEDLDLAGINYTDIAKDGMEQGPNIERTAQLQMDTRHKVVASGGVRHAADIQTLREAGVHEVIVGKAAQNDEFWEGLNQ